MRLVAEQVPPTMSAEAYHELFQQQLDRMGISVRIQ